MRLAAALPLLLLAACSKSPEKHGAEPSAVVTPEIPPVPDRPKTLIPADFAALKLGGKLKSSDATAKYVADGHALAEVTSYVACPEGIDPCDPAKLPDNTVYTYVHQVTPAESVENATLFRTARPAAGFANGVGYDNAQAAAALGPDGQIDVEADNGALVWRVIGGNRWKAGETITLYWQSTLPPKAVSDAYMVETDGSVAIGNGPFPPREKPVDEAARQ